VTIEADDPTVRVIVYNGSGEPGVAGQAAQVLIRGGFRVVDTKNADTFDYDETQIVVQRGDPQSGERVREVLGVGEVVSQPAEQEVADIIIIIGSDFEPPAPEAAP
jgi:polyisoprenyl-teichoic acid--peptidoglycan teichoic acid transferase